MSTGPRFKHCRLAYLGTGAVSALVEGLQLFSPSLAYSNPSWGFMVGVKVKGFDAVLRCGGITGWRKAAGREAGSLLYVMLQIYSPRAAARASQPLHNGSKRKAGSVLYAMRQIYSPRASTTKIMVD